MSSSVSLGAGPGYGAARLAKAGTREKQQFERLATRNQDSAFARPFNLIKRLIGQP